MCHIKQFAPYKQHTHIGDLHHTTLPPYFVQGLPSRASRNSGPGIFSGHIRLKNNRASAILQAMAADKYLELLHKRLVAYTQLPPPQNDLLMQAWKRWELPKDHMVLREQQVADYIWFIGAGAVRIFYQKQGRDITEWFALDGEFFMSITSFFRRIPSRLMVHTLEPTTLFGIHHHDIHRMADEHLVVSKMLRTMLTESLILSQQRMESLQFETAADRYRHLLLRNPAILQRIPGQYIASFLGITPETLSRIRQQQTAG